MTNPFQTLGLSPAFNLDPAELQRRYLDLSSANHPDRFQDPLDQADAAERSAAINEAYHLLKNPETRATSLLAILTPGSAPGTTHGTAHETSADDKALPPNLLMEMMEIREEMEAAIAGKDPATLARLAAWAQRERESLLKNVGELLDQAAGSQAQTRIDFIKRARLDLNALRYVQRMLEQMPA